MGMWFNYTFGLNEAINSLCCPPDNATNVGAWSHCAVAVGPYNGTAEKDMTSYKVGGCFAEHNVTDIRVYLQDKPEGPPSAAPRLVSKPFGVLSFVLLTLAFTSGTLAQTEQTRPNQNDELSQEVFAQDDKDNDLLRKYGTLANTPMCTHFEPDSPDKWRMDSTMPPISYGQGTPVFAAGIDDGTHTGRWLNVTWSADVPVTGDWDALQETLKKNLPQDRFDRLRARVYVPSVPDMFFFPQHPARTGRVAVSSTAVMVPGTFSQCNTTEPTHRGNVRVPYEDGVFFFAASLPPTSSR
ncbi:hypothetical protein A1Q1_00629 [Trichosporon asahii var. asahii CBS 2479]|uniref:Uncharacterized protein n=1 Tax=Trichosporon asahii var. asahii (strain ATCC 90039 / CBS 2479 / JCM 2466 / KCTC 7840 / NBRC 103889/ NCYC 2677 / UAMH 7654) TaxID=1186058 RepID=J6F4H9_TRIAS|nr:hypothetical protein A1Q1_00629 [Trichosporon asahii var. asahii CBS 2479]EJT50162.1 hypothetical protein A1Q1_00629 [Trichosporon asahii var. asahii CBS 2479]